MRTAILHFVAYLAFFLLLLAQLPLQDALPGNTDTWLTIALSNTYLAELTSWLGGTEFGSAMYPAADIHAYGEAAPGTAALFLLFRILGCSDVTAYFLFIATILALTATGVFVLTHAITGNRAAATVAGLAFACAGFTLGNIDDCVMVLWVLPCVALTLLWRVAHGADRRLLTIAAVLGGAQIYFGMYVFVYQSLLLLVAVLCLRAALVSDRRDWLRLAGATGVYLATAAPMLAYYLWSYATLDVWMPPRGHEAGSLGLFGLSLAEHFQSLPGNLIYPEPGLDGASFNYWVGIRSCAWPGVTLLALAALALRRSRTVVCLLALAGVGLLLSWGEIRLGARVVPSPAWLLERVLPLGEFLRINSRAYFLTLLALVVLAALGLARAMSHPRIARYRLTVAIAAGALILLENVPVPLPAFAATPFSPPPYLTTVRAMPRAIQADLPSQAILSFRDFGQDLFSYNRELIYVNWQATHHQDTVNGMNGYFPRSRLAAQDTLDRLPDATALRALADIGVRRLVFHKRLVLPGEADLLSGLKRSGMLRLKAEDDDHAIFDLVR